MAKIADRYFTVDPWTVSEAGFDPKHGRVAESIFSLANEYSGARGFFDEDYTGDSLIGSYFNGVYEYGAEDPSIQYAGIQKRGHFMVNADNWLAMSLEIDGERLDLHQATVSDFTRQLDLRNGVLTRSFVWELADGRQVQLTFTRFISMVDASSAYQQVTLTPLNFSGSATLTSRVDFDTRHGADPDPHWEDVRDFNELTAFGILGKTRTSRKRVFTLAKVSFTGATPTTSTPLDQTRVVGTAYELPLTANEPLTFTKQVTNIVEKDEAVANDAIWQRGLTTSAAQADYATALKTQTGYWDDFWAKNDIQIEGDVADQQGIRYCIFQMAQTYHGQDPTNNIGAKGLTGEAYGGLAFWDTETMCLPFYLFNDLKAAKNLVEFRYSTLDAAKRRAKMVDCEGASYPISTINGDESTSLWQHANTQLQPSTAVAYAIWHYAHLSDDTAFLNTHGIEMLVEISRFLYSRGAWNRKHEFSFYGVMGPDEFQVMTNHNAYTNYMALKTFEFTIETAQRLAKTDPAAYADLVAKTGVSDEELTDFQDASDHMVFLGDTNGMIEQQQGFYDLPHIDVDKIPVTDFPLYDHWSYDRLFRNDMIKQPDVLMFQFLYNQDFTARSKRLNYDYYTPRTIHESSLSPSIHSILAQELHKFDDAINFFGFATRMDLDNFNRNTRDGLHTTSIAAAWLNIVYGFGGLRSDGPELILNPGLPASWQGYQFRINYRGANIQVKVTAETVTLTATKPTPLTLYGKETTLQETPLNVALPAAWRAK
ncbi:glycoside hydrolase family 65 protein [Lacticaseibacillus yichunensis]|uniref:Glycoside hydrolase family 65 protein n=1 Tax=Lacticaseibacillus yichunensis TaxID=2486015 RepID=A0ABW4CPY8_9LACO|nr:glycosyl hydrolase family 65 protein [Lacticaseibacillus yichunensis]